MNEYKNRIIDDEIKFKLKVFGAVLIVGQKVVERQELLNKYQRVLLNFKMKIKEKCFYQ